MSILKLLWKREKNNLSECFYISTLLSNIFLFYFNLTSSLEVEKYGAYKICFELWIKIVHLINSLLNVFIIQ